MERESFEDDEVAKILNDSFVSIKVDKEERPDIDSIYMSVCQAFNGSGGWPLTVIMTHSQKPFFAGTYFPKNARHGSIGLIDLLSAVRDKWSKDKSVLLQSSDQVMNLLNTTQNEKTEDFSDELINKAVLMLKNSFDATRGGFGKAPKFPTPHNLLFLLDYYEIHKDAEALKMVEKTLLGMYKGGIFDHIGFGFSRYSTDQYWLAPHFEKMLYDNALLTMAYLKAYAITKNELYKTVAKKTMDYVLRELTDQEGGFYCAQDADSEGVEGKYYVFTPEEITEVLGEKEGARFNRYFDITKNGNFEGKNIPNLIHSTEFDNEIENLLPAVFEYRKGRTTLHKDDKILTSWNALMISAFAMAYDLLLDEKYLMAAKRACMFIEKNLSDGIQLSASYRDGKKSEYGFLDDYAFYIFSQIKMYEVTFDKNYLEKALTLCQKVMSDFYDTENQGFYLYGKDSESLIMKPKETYDGAIPSGNSMMAFNLVKLSKLSDRSDLEAMCHNQIKFMAGDSHRYPIGYCFYMSALLEYLNYDKKIVCVLKDEEEIHSIKARFPAHASVLILEQETKEYPLKNDMTTYYVCEDKRCLPPVNALV